MQICFICICSKIHILLSMQAKAVCDCPLQLMSVLPMCQCTMLGLVVHSAPVATSKERKEKKIQGTGTGTGKRRVENLV